MMRQQKTADRSFSSVASTAGRWIQRGLGVAATAKGIYDTARTLYSVGQAIAPYAGAAALAFV